MNKKVSSESLTSPTKGEGNRFKNYQKWDKPLSVRSNLNFDQSFGARK